MINTVNGNLNTAQAINNNDLIRHTKTHIRMTFHGPSPQPHTIESYPFQSVGD